MVHVVGEISTTCYVDIAHIVRDTIRDIGYTRAKYGFDCDTCGILISLDEQSSDIAMGVDEALEAKNGEKINTISSAQAIRALCLATLQMKHRNICRFLSL